MNSLKNSSDTASLVENYPHRMSNNENDNSNSNSVTSEEVARQMKATTDP